MPEKKARGGRPGPPAIRIVIADDRPVVREGLKQIVARDPGLAVTGEAQSARELLALVGRQRADLVVLNVSLPGRRGLEILKELKKERPALPVLALSMHPEDQHALRVIKAGAAGYLTKDSGAEEVVKAVRTVARGGRYVSPSIAERLAANIGWQPHATLSDREYQVMCLLAAGKSVGKIAGELSLSPKTVTTFRARILRKMNLETNAQLISYVIQHELAAHPLLPEGESPGEESHPEEPSAPEV